MTEICVTATDFRVHLKHLANSVARGEQRVLMARHGHRMVALVSEEDLAFLRKHKPISPEVEAPAISAGGPEADVHPRPPPEATAAASGDPAPLICPLPLAEALAELHIKKSETREGVYYPEDPEYMPYEDIVRLYEFSEGLTEPQWEWWRGRAYLMMRIHERQKKREAEKAKNLQDPQS